jgi:four helix bundle protein
VVALSIDTFEQLEVQKATHRLVLDVYHVTSALPSDQRFGLVSQMQRAAVAIPANIAEGFKRRGRPDKAHFYNIAQASLEELRYYFILCRDLGYKLDYGPLASQTDHIGRMLTGLVKSLRD